MKATWCMGLVLLALTIATNCCQAGEESVKARVTKKLIDHVTRRLEQSLPKTISDDVRRRARAGVALAGSFWRPEDGTPVEFERFCLESFLSDPELERQTFARIEKQFEVIRGGFHKISRGLREPMDLDLGSMLPIDTLFAEYAPEAHLSEDLFRQKLAFYLLLNWPTVSLEEKIARGPSWKPAEWARARLGDTFTARVPPEVLQKNAEVSVIADTYVNGYNVYPSILEGTGLTKATSAYASDLRLISHWGLRDEIKSLYNRPDALELQKTIFRAMERIADGTIPRAVIDRAEIRWNPVSNQVVEAKSGRAVETTEEGDGRFAILKRVFEAARLLDPYYPAFPTAIDRAFSLERQIPEAAFEKLLTDVVSAPVAHQVGKLIAKRLGRPLQPFDIWYAGFKPRKGLAPEQLDELVRKRYPTNEAFRKDLPNILAALGFSASQATFLSERITVDASRGAGHAMGAQSRDDLAHLRTRVSAQGMDYKGFNIAIHELGHNVEQTWSLHGVEHYSLSGVPNTAFTECFAFLFQARDLEVLGLANATGRDEGERALDAFWSTFEISCVALVDMRVWRWMYAHPDASAADLRSAVTAIAREVWNEYCAPVFGVRDTPILGVYSHMISYPLYLPDYPLGHLVCHQIQSYLQGRDFGTEVERLCRIGCVTPQEWMQKAVGTGLSAEPLVAAAEKAVR
ncbi:MAG TPA: hypothetical protein PKO06_05170 [Candidatus Ozemobacteraceae bacterium]|nr:hypothetical protein [Candidatus Ozemobacteraceae bacterium]